MPQVTYTLTESDKQKIKDFVPSESVSKFPHLNDFDANIYTLDVPSLNGNIVYKFLNSLVYYSHVQQTLQSKLFMDFDNIQNIFPSIKKSSEQHRHLLQRKEEKSSEFENIYNTVTKYSRNDLNSEEFRTTLKEKMRGPNAEQKVEDFINCLKSYSASIKNDLSFEQIVSKGYFDTRREGVLFVKDYRTGQSIRKSDASFVENKGFTYVDHSKDVIMQHGSGSNTLTNLRTALKRALLDGKAKIFAQNIGNGSTSLYQEIDLYEDLPNLNFYIRVNNKSFSFKDSNQIRQALQGAISSSVFDFEGDSVEDRLNKINDNLSVAAERLKDSGLRDSSFKYISKDKLGSASLSSKFFEYDIEIINKESQAPESIFGGTPVISVHSINKVTTASDEWKQLHNIGGHCVFGDAIRDKLLSIYKIPNNPDKYVNNCLNVVVTSSPAQGMFYGGGDDSSLIGIFSLSSSSIEPTLIFEPERNFSHPLKKAKMFYSNKLNELTNSVLNSEPYGITQQVMGNKLVMFKDNVTSLFGSEVSIVLFFPEFIRNDVTQESLVQRSPRNTVGDLENYSRNVLDYYEGFKKAPNRKLDSQSPVFLGLELEAFHDSSYKRSEYIQNVANHSTFGLHAILKGDSSINNAGSELVTIPATLSYHKQAFKTFFDPEEIDLQGLKTNSSCGIHVHIGKDAYINRLAFLRSILFINDEKNREFVNMVAGRNIGIERYCRNWELDRQKPERIFKDVFKSFTGGTLYKGDDWRSLTPRGFPRGAVNLSKGRTLEVRMFSSEVSKQKVFSCLEFCDALTRFCNSGVSLQNLNGEGLIDFIIKSPELKGRYPYLLNHCMAKDFGNLQKKTVINPVSGKEYIRFSRRA